MGISLWILFQAKNERPIQTEAKMEVVVLRRYSEPSKLDLKMMSCPRKLETFSKQ